MWRGPRWDRFDFINNAILIGFLLSVSRKFVATAAHCIITARLKDTLVYLGELDTQDTGKVKELEPAELHRVEYYS